MPPPAGIPSAPDNWPPAPRTPRSFGDELAQAAVLVIDDEPGMRNFLSKVPIDHCAQGDVTADTRDASRLLDENAYDVIVPDNLMPNRTGLEWLAVVSDH